MRKPSVGKPRVRAKTSSLSQRIPTVGRPKTTRPKTLTRLQPRFNKPWK